MIYVQEIKKDPVLKNELKLTHVINSLTFGDTASQTNIKKRFGYNSEHT